MKSFRTRLLSDGLVAGLIGYATVVVFFAALNLLQGRSPFHTAALLGADLFYGLESPDDLTISAGPVLAFNGLHIILLVAAGIFMAWLAELAERIPEGWYVVGVLFLLALAHVVALPVWFSDTVVTRIPLWYVAIATSAAAMAMAGYLLGVRPGLRASLTRDPGPT